MQSNMLNYARFEKEKYIELLRFWRQVLRSGAAPLIFGTESLCVMFLRMKNFRWPRWFRRFGDKQRFRNMQRSR